MDPTHHGPAAALAHPVASARLRAALAAGTRPDPAMVGALVARCRTEPDFFVRDMLTWALTRHPATVTVPLLLGELDSSHAQARSQALHTLSKIGDVGTWRTVPEDLLHDTDDDVARAAWRAAVVLVPTTERAGLARALARELGRGDAEVQLSLSRALLALEDAARDVLEAARTSTDPRVRAHAVATEELAGEPDRELARALDEATRVALLRDAPGEPAC